MLKIPKGSHLIDKVSLQGIRLQPQLYQAINDYCWDHYCYFTNQRSQMFDKLKESLAKNSRMLQFEKWIRIVSHKYTLVPLSAKGSILIPHGGRFNIGDIDQLKFSRFSALYLAENFETAYKERFGLYNPTKKQLGLSAEELALPHSITSVCVKGQILSYPGALKDFFLLVKTIKLPKCFIKRAKKLNIDPMRQVKTLHELKKTIFDPNWRFMPIQYDIPANSQILGQIAHAAGIEAIVYPSRMSKQHKCLAIFPDNFANSTSFIELEGDVCEATMHKRLDAESYLDCV